jgi:hypothetical protein
VSFQTVLGAGDGQCRGMEPASNASMMRIGEPQHGQGVGHRRGLSALAVAAGSGSG